MESDGRQEQNDVKCRCGHNCLTIVSTHPFFLYGLAAASPPLPSTICGPYTPQVQPPDLQYERLTFGLEPGTQQVDPRGQSNDVGHPDAPPNSIHGWEAK
jgi:hypothetical protein